MVYMTLMEPALEESPLWEFVGSVKNMPPDAAENHDSTGEWD
jgi:hypothetical protein